VIVISESDARSLVSVEDAIAVVEQTFAAMARGVARNYPVVREAVGCGTPCSASRPAAIPRRPCWD